MSSALAISFSGVFWVFLIIPCVAITKVSSSVSQKEKACSIYHCREFETPRSRYSPVSWRCQLSSLLPQPWRCCSISSVELWMAVHPKMLVLLLSTPLLACWCPFCFELWYKDNDLFSNDDTKFGFSSNQISFLTLSRFDSIRYATCSLFYFPKFEIQK